MKLPPQVELALATFNNEFPAYVNAAIVELGGVQQNQDQLTLRMKEAMVELKKRNSHAADKIVSDDLRRLTDYQNDWNVRYSHRMSQMLDKLRDILEILHPYGSVYSAGLWIALKMDNMVARHDDLILKITDFQDSLKELNFQDSEQIDSLNRAIVSHSNTIRTMNYNQDYLNRLKADAHTDTEEHG